MEYTQLHQSEKRDLGKLETRLAKLTSQIEDERATLSRYLQAQKKNSDAYNGQVSQRIEEKKADIKSAEEAIRKLSELIRERRGMIRSVAQFNPCRRQADRSVVQEEFVFAKGPKWLEWNAERRHYDGKGANSRFKTFQDIFTPSEYRIIPKREGAFGGVDFDDLSLDPVVVDPERISDSFLEEFHNPCFGLIKTPNGLKGLESLKRKQAMIPALKRFFGDHVKPVPRPGAGKRLSYRVLAVSDYSPEHDGKIIIPHFDTSDKPEERHKVLSVYDSAYSARRMTMKLFPEYEGESKALHEVRESVREAWDSIIHVKASDENYDQTLEDARNLLRSALEILGSPANSHKRAAYERLLSSRDISDINGRINKGATAAKLVSVCNDIFSRIEEVDFTSIAGPQDQNTISGIINSSELILLRYKSTLEQGNIDVGSFERLRGTLQRLNVRPFNIYAGKLMKSFGNANRKHGEEKRDELKKALAVTRLFAAHKLVEDMITAWDTNPETASKKFSYSLIQELYVAGFESQFDVVCDAVNVANLLVEGVIPEQKDDVRNVLKGINFETLLEQITA